MDKPKGSDTGSEHDQGLVAPDNAVEDLELPPEASEGIVGGLPAVQKKLPDE
jgi:hypothetical protein